MEDEPVDEIEDDGVERHWHLQFQDESLESRFRAATAGTLKHVTNERACCRLAMVFHAVVAAILGWVAAEGQNPGVEQQLLRWLPVAVVQVLLLGALTSSQGDVMRRARCVGLAHTLLMAQAALLYLLAPDGAGCAGAGTRRGLQQRCGPGELRALSQRGACFSLLLVALHTVFVSGVQLRLKWQAFGALVAVIGRLVAAALTLRACPDALRARIGTFTVVLDPALFLMAVVFVWWGSRARERAQQDGFLKSILQERRAAELQMQIMSLQGTMSKLDLGNTSSRRSSFTALAQQMSTNLADMVTQGKVLSLLLQMHKPTPEGNGQGAKHAFEALSSFVSNVDVLLKHANCLLSEPELRRLAAAASAIKVSHLWYRRLELLQNDQEHSQRSLGQSFSVSSFSHEQSDSALVAIVATSTSEGVRALVEESLMAPLCRQRNRSCHRIANDDELERPSLASACLLDEAGFVVGVLDGSETLRVAGVLSVLIARGRQVELVVLEEDALEQHTQLLLCARHCGVPVHRDMAAAVASVAAAQRVDKTSPGEQQLVQARQMLQSDSELWGKVEAWEAGKINGAELEALFEGQLPGICAGKLGNPIFTHFVEQSWGPQPEVIFYEDEEMLIFPNNKQAQRSKDGAAAAMSYVHFLIIPKARVYNSVTLTHHHIPMLNRMKEKGLEMLGNSMLHQYYLEDRDLDLSAEVLVNSAEKLGFFIHLHPRQSVGHLHIHCCLTNLWTANGDALKYKNTLLNDVLKDLRRSQRIEERRKRRSSREPGSSVELLRRASTGLITRLSAGATSATVAPSDGEDSSQSEGSGSWRLSDALR